VCPSCRQTFDLSLRQCPTHRLPLVEAQARATEPHGLFEVSEARTDLDRDMLGAEAPVTLPATPAVPPLALARLAQLPADATLLEPAFKPHAPEVTPLESKPAGSVRGLAPVEGVRGGRSRMPEVTPVDAPAASAVGRPEAPTQPGVPAVPFLKPLSPSRPVEKPAPSRSPSSAGPVPSRLGASGDGAARASDKPGPGRSASNLGAPVDAGPRLGELPARSPSNLGTPLTSVAGQLFDGYLTTGVLAEGGMGIVYEAQHPILGTQAVVKVLKKLLTADPVSMRRMVTEGQTLSALTHRNVVRVFGFGYLADGRPWLLMERLVGETLFSLLEGRGALPLAEALPLMRQLAAGLEATHALGVVHRDLKPDNVYVVVEPDGERLVKLIDFGIARPDSLEAPEGARTAVGRFVGTPAYGAPELFVGSPYSQAADVYALGIVFFEMLAGRRPFAETDLPTLTKQHLDAAPPRLGTLVKGLDERMDHLVASMLSKRADERPTIEAVRAALEALAAPAQRRQSVWPWVLVALVAIGVGLGLGFWLR
jgi:tRNA A-37 threonylcarbamoyl transferase component Bud32